MPTASDLSTPGWTELSKHEKADRVRPYANEHKSAGQIAQILGVSRNAIVGVVHRNRDTIKLHGNQSTGAAKLRALRTPHRKNLVAPPKSAMRESSIAIVEKVFEPLPGSTPVDLVSRRGCAWPVMTGDQTLYCNCQIADEKLPYCADHLLRYRKV